MQTEVLHIKRVTPWGTRTGGTIFIVESEEYRPETHTPYILRSFEPWVGALCDRAAAKGIAVRVTFEWVHRYGSQIRSIELEPEASKSAYDLENEIHARRMK